MPEGPEVKLNVDNLQANFANNDLLSIEIVGGRFEKHNLKIDNSVFPFANVHFNCKGKFIYWTSEDKNKNIAITLGMTGSFSFQKEKHSALKFNFKGKSLFFNDIRRFGTFKILNEQELRSKLDSLGWDILQESIPNNIIARTRKWANKTVAELLMNQVIQSGVGNYIKSDACYLAGILPSREVSSLSDEEIIKLYQSVIHIAKESYMAQGATIATYKDIYGNAGGYGAKFKIYGRKNDDLGNPVQRITTKDGRTSFFVQSLQH